MQDLMGGLTIAAGLVTGGAGVAAARQDLQSAQRAHRRTARIAAGRRESWQAWFVSGFSDLTMGIRWLSAVLTWFLWTLGGLGLIGFGIRLLRNSAA